MLSRKEIKIYTYKHIYGGIGIYKHIDTCKCLYVYMCVYRYIRTHIYVCVYACKREREILDEDWLQNSHEDGQRT